MLGAVAQRTHVLTMTVCPADLTLTRASADSVEANLRSLLFLFCVRVTVTPGSKDMMKDFKERWGRARSCRKAGDPGVESVLAILRCDPLVFCSS